MEAHREGDDAGMMRLTTSIALLLEILSLSLELPQVLPVLHWRL